MFERVHGPLGAEVNAKYGILNGKIAVMEMAEASGINLVKHEELNPFSASTYGVGEVLKAILDKGIRDIYIGIGGSATNDGGAGMLASLGAEFYDSEGNKIGYTPAELKKLKSIDLSSFDERIQEAKITVLI